MFNEEKDNVKIYVINSNTGHIVRSEVSYTSEFILTIVKRYRTKDSIVIASIDNICHCFYIKSKLYVFNASNAIELIDFFKDVLGGVYDNARDSFHIQYGRVATLCSMNNLDIRKYEDVLNCIDDIWETRYYSRFLRRGKND